MTLGKHKIPITILICDHDENERKLIRKALVAGKVSNSLRFVQNGNQMLEYLEQRGEFAGEKGKAPRPGLILLDFNMPKADWRDALTLVHADESLRDIPIVVFSNSKLDEDMIRSYDLGVTSFLSKPVTFSGLVDAMKIVDRYWFEIVELPPAAAKEAWRPAEEDTPAWRP